MVVVSHAPAVRGFANDLSYSHPNGKEVALVDPDSQARMRVEIADRMLADRSLLDALRAEIRPLRDSVRRIQSRSTTAISLVGTDGGNNRLEFDPFLVQLVRVVDSSNNEYCLEAITPTTSVTTLSKRQFDATGTPVTALGEMMAFLGLTDLTKLSHMIRRNDTDDRPTSPSWVQVYRELVEWAILFSLVRTHPFGSDTLIVCDGLLRSKVFAGEHFRTLLAGFEGAIKDQYAKRRRRIYHAWTTAIACVAGNTGHTTTTARCGRGNGPANRRGATCTREAARTTSGTRDV
jgi:hypothetical protein